MLTDEQINEIVQENVWCVEDKTRIIYTINVLKQQNKQLIEGLRFYADEKNHNDLKFDKFSPYTLVEDDDGKRARDILQSIQGGNT